MKTSAALVWTLFSWTGYSQRYLAYARTWCADAVIIVPFVVITVLLSLPMAKANCAAVAQNGRFEVTTPPGSSFGRIAFPSDGRVACQRLFAVWILLIVVCALFALSALSAGFLDLGERQLTKAMYAPGRDGVDIYAPRPSIAEDRLNLNRPVTVAPRGRGRAGAPVGGLGYEEQLDQPAAWMSPDNGFGYPSRPRAG